MSGETFGRFEDELYSTLFRMVHHGGDVEERLGGVAAIEALCCVGDGRGGSSQFLGSPEGQRQFVTRTAAARRLARRGPASSSDHVEFEVGRALEWLQRPAGADGHLGGAKAAADAPGGAQRRLAACLVLRELAKHAPTLFYARVRDFFERVWPALMDARSPDVREAAAAALGAALEIVPRRPTAQHSHFYCAIYAKAHAALAPHVDKYEAANAFLRIKSPEKAAERRRSLPEELQADYVAGDAPAAAPAPESAGSPETPWSLKRLFRRRGSDASSAGDRTPRRFAVRVAAGRRASPGGRRRGRRRPGLAGAGHGGDGGHGPRRAAGRRRAPAPRGRVHDAAVPLRGNQIFNPTSMFREACDAAIALREHRSRAIRKAVTDLLPRLAQYCPDAFARAYLKGTTKHLLAMAVHRTSGELRDAAYEAMGRLALAVKHHLVPALPEIVATLCDCGASRGARSRARGRARGRGAGVAEEKRRRGVVVDCVADVRGAGEKIPPPHADALLDALFANGLCDPDPRRRRRQGAAVAAAAVRARLLDALTSVLDFDASPYAPPGWARPLPRPRRRRADSAPRTRLEVDARDEDLILLSLRTLGSFSMEGVCLLPLARDCASRYLDASSAAVRSAAVASCARLGAAQESEMPNFKGSSRPFPARVARVERAVRAGERGTPAKQPGAAPLGAWYFAGPSAVVVDDVLRRLLAVALADDDPGPRRAVVRALRADARFDGHLARSAHVDALALLLHDEDTELQLSALALLGRLAARNPAAVLSRAAPRRVGHARCPAGRAAKSAPRGSRRRAARREPRARKAVWPLAAEVVAALPLGYRDLAVKAPRRGARRRHRARRATTA
ncbi:phosphatidylinositol kinase [Aureococcus anophagefferens]|nr:phosphatidylinositol kinase [Aureococcus anophagefferens]